jgi:hypothetical protein
MARINQGISGGFSGKVGTVTGANWNGIDYMRSNESVSKDSKSTAQLNQRARLTTVVQFLRPLKGFLRIGFKNRAGGMSAFNAAVSCNLEHALAGSFPDYRIDYSRVRISQGWLPGALNPAALAGPAATIGFTWENNSSAIDARADDRAAVVIYNQTRKSALSFTGNSTRLGGSQSITLPASFSGDEVHCYISFQNASQTVISDSRFVGSLIVL